MARQWGNAELSSWVSFLLHDNLSLFMIAPFIPVWPCSSLFGPANLQLALFGPIHPCLALSTPVWLCSALFSAVQACLALFISVWPC